MSSLVFKKLNKIYDNDVQAVFDFSLDIKDKEFIVFVGPSGCGKSTTLRMVAGLENITSGELYIDNVLVNNIEPKDRNIAMVFQNYALYPHMTVYGNMAFALKLRKIPCPVYEENEEANNLIAENKKLISEAKALRKKAGKKNEDKEMIAEVSKMYDQIIANDEHIKEVLEKGHIKGIWEEKIQELTEQIGLIEDEKKKYVHYLEKGRGKWTALTLKEGDAPQEVKFKNNGEPSTEIGEEGDVYLDVDANKYYVKGANKYTDEAMIALKEGIEQRDIQKAKIEKDIEYYKTTDVPLFKSRKLTRYEIDIEINRAAKILDLEKYLLRKPSALSGGQRQRVALGRCIVRNPKVFLMDEPLSNLDAKLRVQTRSEIINIHKRVNATTIYVTHDQTEAMTMADRIVVMKDGYIQQIDTPFDIYYNPNNTFVAGFIGNPPMNFLNGKFDGKSFCLDSEDGNVQVAFKLNKEQIALLKDYKDEELVVGIRPENMFQKGSPELIDALNYLDVSCELRELMGYDSIIHSHISDQPFLVKVSSTKDIKVGDVLEVGFNNDALYFFKREDGNRIR